MSAARVTEVADAVAALIRSVWNPAAPDRVRRGWTPDYELEDMRGRQVTVFGHGYANAGPATRGADWRDSRVTVLTEERYTLPAADGDALDAWIDERVRWVEQTIFLPLENPRDSNPWFPVLPGLFPQDSAVEMVCDPEMMRERKVFSSIVSLTFRESRSPK